MNVYKRGNHEKINNRTIGGYSAADGSCLCGICARAGPATFCSTDTSSGSASRSGTGTASDDKYIAVSRKRFSSDISPRAVPDSSPDSNIGGNRSGAIVFY
jgi:hypothetical protein